MSNKSDKIIVNLLTTAPSDSLGSMQRYLSLLKLSLADYSDLEVKSYELAPTFQILKCYHSKARTLRHHLGNLWHAWRNAKSNCDLFHIIDGSYAYIAQFLPPEKTVITAHDLIPYLQIKGRFPQHRPPGRSARYIINSSVNQLKKSAGILSVSHNTKQDLIHAGCRECRITVSALPIEDKFISSFKPYESRVNSIPMMFHLGNNGFYKNRIGVIQVFNLVKQQMNCRLVMAGPSPDAHFMQLVQKLNLSDDIEFIEYPTDQEIVNFYQNANLMLFPSIYEGFGWPPIEAMACGCPVVASNAGSLPDVTGPSPTADYNDHASLANHCLTILQNQQYAQELSVAGREHAAKFTIESMGHRVHDFYLSMLNKK